MSRFVKDKHTASDLPQIGIKRAKAADAVAALLVSPMNF